MCEFVNCQKGHRDDARSERRAKLKAKQTNEEFSYVGRYYYYYYYNSHPDVAGVFVLVAGLVERKRAVVSRQVARQAD